MKTIMGSNGDKNWQVIETETGKEWRWKLGSNGDRNWEVMETETGKE